jgi:hypothetical protein
MVLLTGSTGPSPTVLTTADRSTAEHSRVCTVHMGSIALQLPTFACIVVSAADSCCKAACCIAPELMPHNGMT